MDGPIGEEPIDDVRRGEARHRIDRREVDAGELIERPERDAPATLIQKVLDVKIDLDIGDFSCGLGLRILETDRHAAAGGHGRLDSLKERLEGDP